MKTNTTNTTTKNINEVIREIKEYMDMQDQLKQEIEALKAQAIEYMDDNGVDEVLTDAGKITYREVITNRFDSTSFKKVHSDLYAEFVKKTSNMRFTCN